jgi:hypothetical protein
LVSLKAWTRSAARRGDTAIVATARHGDDDEQQQRQAPEQRTRIERHGLSSR